MDSRAISSALARGAVIFGGRNGLRPALEQFVGMRAAGAVVGFTFDEEIAEDDAIVEEHGVTLLVDSLSYPYLAGAEVDYKEDLQGAQFIVANPNASATCGCGNSFAV